MIRPLFNRLVLCVGLLSLAATATFSREAIQDQPGTVWTAIIPDAFPDNVFTWHMGPGGSYREDGRDVSSGLSIQPTLSGHWSREGARMTLRQDDLPYVFDGVVLGNLYGGTLYFGGRAVSRFCAAKGEQAPERCDGGAGVAILAAE
ncbi:hypothetical protein [Bradyrhizobium sp. STM 3562]|uniref:hypothetical protein n=1 Tax=Bradyrhizobium sp. STM 3562 TaxID=578924 RepID=UPI00389004F4